MPASTVPDAFIRMVLLLAPTQRDSRDIIRKFPSVYQLCPSLAYLKGDPAWLKFDPLNTGSRGGNSFTDSSSPYLYTDAYTGFC
jgi:hypothetical protein